MFSFEQILFEFILVLKTAQTVHGLEYVKFNQVFHTLNKNPGQHKTKKKRKLNLSFKINENRCDL